MTAIQNQYRQTGTAVGVKQLELNPAFSHHQVAVEGVTGQVVVTFRPAGFSSYQGADDNVLSQNSSAVFVLGSLDGLQLEPVDTSVEYRFVVSSF